MTVVPVRTRRDRKRFLDLPYRLYRDAPFWVPPLRVEQAEVLSPRKNPFFEHGRIQCFLALDAGGEVVGRVAGIVNGMHLERYDDGNGFFGFFETVERYEVAEALLDAAAGWLREQGLTGVRGPVNPSMNDVAGLLVDGFDRAPFVMMPYNRPYYAGFLEQYGFRRAMTMWAYYFHTRFGDTPRMLRGARLLLQRYPDVRLRTLDMDRFDEEARTILELYNAAWADNWGHVALTDAELKHLAANLKQVLDPDLVLFVEEAGTPVAFTIALPNINEALIHIPDGRLLPFGIVRLLVHAKLVGFREARNILMGVLPERRNKGYDMLLHARLIENCAEKGIHSGELSWVLESNAAMIRLAERVGAVCDKEYAMYERAL